MGHHHHIEINRDERFELSAEGKKRIFLALAIGLVMTCIGIFMLAMGYDKVEHHGASHGTKHEVHATAGGHEAVAHEGTANAMAESGLEGRASHEAAAEGHKEVAKEGLNKHAEVAASHHEFHWTTRLLADLWHNAVFFTGLALIGTFFVAFNYVAYAGWSAGIIRVPMAMGSFLPITGAILLIVFLLGQHDLFHWTHSELSDKASPHYDKIIAGKGWYLSVPFFLIRMVLFFGLWILYRMIILRNSLAEDSEPGSARWKKNVYFSAGFLVIFAVSESMISWDWLMSIDAHWFSTLYGWYCFASWFVSGLSVITLTVLYLKKRGYLAHVNTSVLHDLGKFMFAFSIFWTYLWVAQFLLYYYANISEETIYFIQRRDGFDNHYTFLFFFNLAINFVFPFLFFMSRDAKRKELFLQIGAIGLLAGHWLDFYLLIMPGATKGNSSFGFTEFGLCLTFVSLFIYVVSNTLSKHPLIAKNHPMLEESLHHDI